jgi:hypothetical protein
VGARAPQFRARATRHREDVMPFFGGKSGLAAQFAACRPGRSTDPAQSGLASDAPSEGPGQPLGRWLGYRPLGPLTAHSAPARRPRCPSVQHDTNAGAPVARPASIGSRSRARAIHFPVRDVAFVSPCPPGYISQGGHRIYWTVH